jgi:phosphoribosyl 1,2-cyclic phosphodiesterase
MKRSMNYKIISSGSKGNCIIINDIMIDCGVAFKDIKEELYGIKYLLITHTHSDHLKLQTIQKIVEQFPTIQIIGNYEVHQAFNCNIIANTGVDIVTDDYTFTPFECVHDVLTYGFTWNYQGLDIIYATDTSTLEHAPNKKYDYFFLESNHDEAKLEEVRNQKKGSYNPYLSGKRHLSTQSAKSFYFMNRKGLESEFIELHKSNRFY